MPSNTTPLGYIELDNGTKAITAMNDIFLNYMFNDPANWETLRETVNIIVEAYRHTNPDTAIAPINGKIIVETQYKYLLDVKNVTRDQDIKMTADDELVFIEFQNRSKTIPPIEVRAVEYFALGIGHSKGKVANQLWLMAEDLESVIHGKSFARYILKDEATGEPHPGNSGILYVSLSKLAKIKSPAGELAAFLLGMAVEPKDVKVKTIANCFTTSFDLFRMDKEAVKMLSLTDRARNEGLVEGMEKGALNLLTEFAELIKQGFTADEAYRELENRHGSPQNA